MMRLRLEDVARAALNVELEPAAAAVALTRLAAPREWTFLLSRVASSGMQWPPAQFAAGPRLRQLLRESPSTPARMSIDG